MKQVYSFYYTGEEHRRIEKRNKEKYIILSLCFALIFYCLAYTVLFLYTWHYETPHPYLYIGCSILVAIPVGVFLGLLAYQKNYSPTRDSWYGKQEYTIDGSKVTIRITTANGFSKTEDFMIQSRVDRPEGIYLYKNHSYYIVIPHRVQPTIIND